MKSALLHLLFNIGNYTGSVQCIHNIIVDSIDIIFALLSAIGRYKLLLLFLLSSLSNRFGFKTEKLSIQQIYFQ